MKQSAVTTVENKSRTIVHFSSTLYETRLWRDLDLLSVSSRVISRTHWLVNRTAWLHRRYLVGASRPRFSLARDALALSAERPNASAGNLPRRCYCRDNHPGRLCNTAGPYRRETGILYFSMRNPARLASRDVNDNWGARRFPFPRNGERRCMTNHRLASLSHGRYQRLIVKVVSKLIDFCISSKQL